MHIAEAMLRRPQAVGPFLMKCLGQGPEDSSASKGACCHMSSICRAYMIERENRLPEVVL